MVSVIHNRPKEILRLEDVFPHSLTPVLTDNAGNRLGQLQPTNGPRIGYLVGSDLNEQIVHDPKQAIHNQGSTDFDMLRVTGQQDFVRLHVTKNYFRQQFRYGLKYDCLVNLVTDADQHPRVLRNMARMIEGFGGKVVNHPAAVLRSTREQVARQLAGLPGVRVPKVLRLRSASPAFAGQALARASMAFPVLVRPAGAHGGNFIGLFDTAEALGRALQPKQDYIVTEFVDFRSNDGLYRKYRMFFIGETRVFRHMLVADEWNIHADNGNAYIMDRPALREEEQRLFADPDAAIGPAAIAALDGIRRAVGLDFMGVDFGFTRDGKVVLFEANATMNFFPFYGGELLSYRRACLPGAQAAFETLIGVRGEGVPKGAARRAPVLTVPFRNERLCPRIIETDRRYFEMGAVVTRLPGADIAVIEGLAHCPSAIVVHRVDPALITRQGLVWVRRVEDGLLAQGATQARIYVDEPDRTVTRVLEAAGYEMRHEIAFGAATAAAAEHGVELREIASDADWRRKLDFHETVPERPDGHDASAADWVALERAKCAHGMRAFLAWRDDLVVGTIGAIAANGLWRLKNIVVHTAYRRQSVGRGMIAGIGRLARQSGTDRMCLFGVEGTAGEALYRACGFAETGIQVEWAKPLATP